MYKKTVTYKDYDNVERTEDFYFDLSEAEVMIWENSVHGGVSSLLKRIIASKDMPQLVHEFKELVLMAYGEKSADGRRFDKSKELSDAFSHTRAYSIIFMELATDAEKATEFVKGIIPTESSVGAVNGQNPSTQPIAFPTGN